MAGKNQDFLSQEMVDTVCLSSDKVVKCLFTNQLSRTGNLIMSAEACGVIANTNKERWGAALITGNTCRTEVKKLHESILRYLTLHSTARVMYCQTVCEDNRNESEGGGHSQPQHFQKLSVKIWAMRVNTCVSLVWLHTLHRFWKSWKSNGRLISLRGH